MDAQSLAKKILVRGKNKTALWPVLFLVILGFAFPAISFAGIGDLFNPVGNIVNAIGNAFGNVIAALIIGLLTGILGTAAVLLGWAIDPWFVRFSYTGMEGIVGIGWPVVRDLSYMMLVLSLIAIALGTALRIGEYQARKTLVTLIVVALLINFTPVFLGLIIDGTNIVMNFFLEGFVGAEAFKNVFTNFFNGMSTKNVFQPAFWLELIMLAIFSLLATVIFLLFAVLFIMRRVVIWTLVILSPLAFVAYILPITRKFFNTWWNQFIQWSIIGISASFFLWLGNQMIGLAGTADFSADVGGVEGFLQETFNQAFAYGIAILFLIYGFFMALNTSAIGAGAVIGTARKWTRNTSRQAAGSAATRAGTWTREKITASERTQKIAQRMSTMQNQKPTWGEGQTGIGGWMKRSAATITSLPSAPVAGAARTIGRVGSVMPSESDIRAVEKQKEETKKLKRPQDKLASFRSSAGRAERVGRLLSIIDEKQLGAAQKFGLTDDEIVKVAKEALITDPGHTKKIISSAPHLMEKVFEQETKQLETELGKTVIDKDIPKILDAAKLKETPESMKPIMSMIGGKAEKMFTDLQTKRQRVGLGFTDEAEQAEYKTPERKLYAHASTKEIETWSLESVIDPATKKFRKELEEAMQEHWSGNQLGTAGKTLGRAFIEETNSVFSKHNKTEDWKKNPTLLSYLQRNAAQELGFRDPIGATPPPATPAPPPPPPGGGGPGGPGGSGKYGYAGPGTGGSGGPAKGSGGTTSGKGYKGPGV